MLGSHLGTHFNRKLDKSVYIVYEPSLADPRKPSRTADFLIFLKNRSLGTAGQKDKLLNKTVATIVTAYKVKHKCIACGHVIKNCKAKDIIPIHKYYYTAKIIIASITLTDQRQVI